MLSLPSVEYEVFLSFRGPDTRHKITDILYRFLIHTRIHTFKDDDELRKGEIIWSNLVKAIDQSKIYVPIISKGYADSKWCLKELAEIVERQKQDNRRIILPIFYLVDPSDVRHQTGPYRDAFREHAKHFDEKTVQCWKKALTEVGALKGWHVESDQDQGAKADEVYAVIWSHLKHDNYVLDTDELVGVDHHIQAVVERLSLDSKNEVTVVGIHGLGGIGKTTIAKAAYNKISWHFDRCCFIENVRDAQEKADGVVVLQKKIIFDILRMDSTGFNDHNRARKMIKGRVSKFKVLIVYDDVDDKFRLEDIMGIGFQDFVSGSRFIVTSRNRNVLSGLNGNQCKLYEVGSMSHSHSLELFCKHAFKKSSPRSDYKVLADQFVRSTGGLPLTLKVLGSLLFEAEASIWEEKLEQLLEVPEPEVMRKLKISYDALEYEAKQIFLDVAYSFIGKDKENPSYMWSTCKFSPMTNIHLLTQRSMLKIGDRNEFQMHDQLRDMGRDIIRQENIEQPWLRSRVQLVDGGTELLIHKEELSKIKALDVYSKSDADVLNRDHFLNLKQLRYFASNSTIHVGDYSDLLQELRWLELRPSWKREAEPNFSMHKLVILILPGQSLTDDWKGWTQIKMAKMLKVMQLGDISKLTILPYFPASLEVLKIHGFNGDNKQELDIRELKNLKTLFLTNCHINKIIGGTFGMLRGLARLNITNLRCTNLEQVVSDVDQLLSLKVLRTQGVKDIEFQAPVGLNKLHTSSQVSNLAELLELEELQICRWKYGFDFPSAGNYDPEDAVVWWEESKLIFSDQTMATASDLLPPFMLPSSIVQLKIAHCQVPRLPSLDNLDKLTTLIISGCRTVCGHWDGFERLKSLWSLQIFGVVGLTRIGGLGDLLSSPDCKLEVLSIISCISLTEILQFELQGGISIRSLQKVDISNCPMLLDVGSMIRGLSKFPMLSFLRIEKVKMGSIYSNDNGGLIREGELEGLASLEELVSLSLIDLPSIGRIPSLSRLRNLARLFLSNAPNLREIKGLGELKSLICMRLTNCPLLARLWPVDQRLTSLEKLERMYIENCRSFTADYVSALRISLPKVAIKWDNEPVSELLV